MMQKTTREQRILNAQIAYHAICEASWKRYENNEITYGAHECTVDTASQVYYDALKKENVPIKTGARINARINRKG